VTGFLIRKPKLTFAIYVVLDTICVGAGMGVPIFCILFGFVVGWYSAIIALAKRESVARILRAALRNALATSGITFLWMLVIWGRTVSMLFDPSSDFVNFGIPMILYEPRVSFIGWLVLMIFISPFLQLLMTIFGSYLKLIIGLREFGETLIE
jgi:hypothetical protein